jgi:hypothetical protein
MYACSRGFAAIASRCSLELRWIDGIQRIADLLQTRAQHLGRSIIVTRRAEAVLPEVGPSQGAG